MKLSHIGVVLLCLLPSLLLGVSAQVQCGRDAGGAVCANGLCCSKFGYCGGTSDYCGDGCQSQCKPGGTPTPSTPTPTPSGDRPCLPGRILHLLVRSFGGFATTGDTNTRKKEIAAFFAQTSHETTGGWPTAPDGPYAWGYCFTRERGDNPGVYCRSDAQWPCAPNKKYFGRGPIQISWNYNYGPAGKAIGSDLLNNPDLVTSDATVSFKTALWFWMTPQSPKPSSHAVITGQWTPSAADQAAGRAPGFGLITNIINGGIECGKGANDQVADRIGFYRRYCSLLGISPGDNLDCYNQTPYPT